jgi:AraC-like DNA-binding protein
MVQEFYSPYLCEPDPEEAQRRLARLAALLLAHAPYDGRFELPLGGAYAVRYSQPSKDLLHGVAQPGLCIVAQGAKTVILGNEMFEYDASRLLVYSVDVPVAGQVTKASLSAPFICLKLDLDSKKIAELVLKVFPDGLPQTQRGHAICMTEADPGIIQAAIRLMELQGQAREAGLLAPLAVEEILVRLLLSPIGGRVAQIGQEDSRLQQVSKAVSWVRMNFDRPLDVQRLAGMVHMSLTTFHQHFKSVTAMSPLQYQKVLRLQEARRLMLSRMLDAGMASRQVGYQSASQFTREYGRFFGQTPTRDIALLREGGAPSAATEL